jgi:hypothetical protein
MDGMEGSVPPDRIGVDRPTSFGPVQPIRWSDVRGSAHADFGDHHEIAIYTEVADAVGGTVTYTALRHESNAGAATYRAMWTERRFAEGWIVAAPVLADEGAPSVGAPIQIARDDAARRPWNVGSYPSTLPRPSQRLQAHASPEPAAALAHLGLKHLADRWGPNLLANHGFDLARAPSGLGATQEGGRERPTTSWRGSQRSSTGRCASGRHGERSDAQRAGSRSSTESGNGLIRE